MPKKNGFDDPIKAPDNNTRYPDLYKMPEYDKRSSCFVKCGEDFGVGFNGPVGGKGAPKLKGPAIPYGRVDTLKLYED